MRKSVIIILVLVLSILLSGCAGAEERAWQTGQKALSENNYEEAAAAFAKAGSFQDASRLLIYSRACSDLENGAFSAAEEAFRSLGDFKDSTLMLLYCKARALEHDADSAYTEDFANAAVNAGQEAYALFTKLAFFRDSDSRASACRDQLYSRSLEWMNLSRYKDAASGFAALADWQDSAALCLYSKASDLEQQGAFIEAADVFLTISDFRDSSSRADAVFRKAYQSAADLKSRGDYEGAINAFAALNSYQDAAYQKEECTVLLINTLLESGSFANSLQKYSLLKDRDVFPLADPEQATYLEPYLDGFINAWLTAHSHIMNAYFSCLQLQPYLEPEGELDKMLHTSIIDDDTPLNYGYIYQGKKLPEIRELGHSFMVAEVIGNASYITADGLAEMEEALFVLLDCSKGNPIAVAVSVI